MEMLGATESGANVSGERSEIYTASDLKKPQETSECVYALAEAKA